MELFMFRSNYAAFSLAACKAHLQRLAGLQRKLESPAYLPDAARFAGENYSNEMACEFFISVRKILLCYMSLLRLFWNAGGDCTALRESLESLYGACERPNARSLLLEEINKFL